MNCGEKVFIECIIDKKLETHLGTYYEAHIDQYNDSFSGQMDSSISIKIIEKFNTLKAN